MHLHLQLVFRGMEAPSFRCTEISATSLQLHYYSKRPLLGPLVKGIVQASSRFCFNHEVKVTLLHGRELDGCGGRHPWSPESPLPAHSPHP